MFSNLKRIKLSYLILLIAPSFTFFWHFTNTQLPLSDAVDYLNSAHSIYSFLLSGQYFDFFISFFNERGWRPIIFQLFIVPFLIVSFGDMNLAVILTHVFFNSLSVLFIFKLFSKFLNLYTSAICALILSLSLNVMFGGEPLPLFSEIAFVPFFIATIYYLINSDLFKNKRKTNLFILFFTLCLLTRPVEAILYLLLPLIIIIYKRHTNYLNMYEIIKGFFFPIFFLWVLFTSRLIPKISDSILKIDPPNSLDIFINFFILISLTFLILSATLYVFKKRQSQIKQSNNYFVKSMFITSLVTWFWYTPRFGSLYGWVYDTSIGNQLSYMKQNIPSFLELVSLTIRTNGVMVFLLCIFLYICNFVFKLLSSQEVPNIKKNQTNIYANLNMIVLTSSLLPMLIYFTTFQTSFRKISTIVTIILILLFITILKNTKNIKFNNIILTFFLVIQSFTLYNYIDSSQDNEFWQDTKKEYYVEKILGTEFPKPVNKKVNQYNELVEFIKNSYEKNSGNKIILALSDSPFPIERYHMKFMCKVYMIHCDFLPFKSFKKNNLDLLNENYQILIVSSKKSSLDISNGIANSIKNNLNDSLKTSSPIELYSIYLHYLHSSNNLAMYNLNVEKCEIFYKDFSACLISKKIEN